MHVICVCSSCKIDVVLKDDGESVMEQAWNYHPCPGSSASRGSGMNFINGWGGTVQTGNLDVLPHPRDLSQRGPARESPETHRSTHRKDTILV